MSITNKDALKNKIHEIHNFLRNNGAGYGMNALKVFVILYGIKKIEQDGWLNKLNLKRPCCEFSYLLKVANENQGERLAELIFGDVLQSIFESELKGILFYEIPRNIKASVFVHLIKEIDKITEIEKSCNVFLSGKIYEYFIGRDKTAISELGAYFTDRHIVEYILKKMNPTINDDGSIKTMVDMFGGSGGFTIGYINFLKEKYPGMIDWTTELSKISHFDMNEDVIKLAGLEFFCLTGVIPNMTNLVYKNSFTDEFNAQKYKYILTNPPYGGDKNKKSDTQVKREKLKFYIKNELSNDVDEGVKAKRQKQLKEIDTDEKCEKIEMEKMKVSVPSCSGRIQKFAHDHKLSGNDKESCSLMLLMDMVEPNGTAIGVLKEGVVFDKTYKNLRKCLVENFNLREVISVPQDQFENTSTKTSIVIFDNTEEKTSTVVFSDLSVEKYEDDIFDEIEDKIVILANRGDNMGVSDNLVSRASRDEILSNSICSLNGKDYNKNTSAAGDGYEFVLLGDICDFYIYKSQEPNDVGSSNFYTCSNVIQRCETGNMNGEYVLMGSRGTISEALHYCNGNFGCGNNMFVFNSSKYNNQYIYYMLLSQKRLIDYAVTVSTIPMISMSKFKSIVVPVPKSQTKVEEWVDKISIPFTAKNAKRAKIKELESLIQNKILSIQEDCDEIELGAISDINMGSTPDTKNYNYWNGGHIPWVSVSELNNNIVYQTNKCITQAGADKMNNRLVKKGSILLSFKLSIGKLGIAGVDMYCNEAIVYLNSKISGISKLYLYYLLSVTDLEKLGRCTIGNKGNIKKEI
jgi:type I restriction-modification system DNA methylase subunit